MLAHLRTDLPPAELFRLAQAMAHVDPAKVTGCVVQGSIGNVGGASVVLPFTGQAKRYGNDARKDATIRHCLDRALVCLCLSSRRPWGP